MLIFPIPISGIETTAFLVSLDGRETSIDLSGPIKWKNVTHNAGGHYSSETGKYTVPLNGFYSFTVMQMAINRYAYSDVMVDGVTVYSIMDHVHGGWKQHGGTVTLKLKSGSKVHIQSRSQSKLRGYSFWENNPGLCSWFSGHLLIPA